MPSKSPMALQVPIRTQSLRSPDLNKTGAADLELKVRALGLVGLPPCYRAQANGISQDRSTLREFRDKWLGLRVQVMGRILPLEGSIEVVLENSYTSSRCCKWLYIGRFFDHKQHVQLQAQV